MCGCVVIFVVVSVVVCVGGRTGVRTKKTMGSGLKGGEYSGQEWCLVDGDKRKSCSRQVTIRQ